LSEFPSMAARSLTPAPSIRPLRKNLWLERMMAAIATLNLVLVLFDLTYVPWRDFWLRGRFQIPLTAITVKVPTPPQITQWYDPIKGIEPNRDTQTYLETVNDFKQTVSQSGLRSAQAQRELATLRQLSTEMIDSNPFALADKSGTLEKIKNRMRDRVYPDKPRKASARQAFNLFWSADYLSQNYQREIGWFDQNVGDLIRTNYYRSISESGDFTNNFAVIDAPFVILFLLEFLARTFWLSRRYTGVSWLDAMVWRWYDILLFFPFGLLFSGWAWLRVIPTTIRLHQARIINLKRVRDRSVEGFVGSISNELTEVVLLQTVDQMQAAIRRGELSRVLAATGSTRVDINNVDEIAELTDLFINLTVQHVLPAIQPQLAALISQSVDTTLSQTPGYRALRGLPGVGQVPTRINDRIAENLLSSTNTALIALLQDAKLHDLVKQLIHTIGTSYQTGLKNHALSKEIQGLLIDLLEEFKLSYVQRPGNISPENLLEEARQLRSERESRLR